MVTDSRNHHSWCPAGRKHSFDPAQGDLMKRLIDSFVVAQLRPELGTSETMPTMNHPRLEDGRREIDILLQAPDAGVVAIEIRREPNQAARMQNISFGSANKLSDQFATGVFFHTGPHPYAISENVYTLPSRPFGIES
jgi:uncharacterized protein